MIHTVSLKKINDEHRLIGKIFLPGLPRKLLVFARQNCIGFAEFVCCFENAVSRKLDWEKVKIATQFRLATQQPVWGEVDFLVEPDHQYAVLSDCKPDLVQQLKDMSRLHVKSLLIGQD